MYVCPYIALSHWQRTCMHMCTYCTRVRAYVCMCAPATHSHELWFTEQTYVRTHLCVHLQHWGHVCNVYVCTYRQYTVYIPTVCMYMHTYVHGHKVHLRTYIHSILCIRTFLQYVCMYMHTILCKHSYSMYVRMYMHTCVAVRKAVELIRRCVESG